MKISFLLNFPSRHPFGGYKVIFTYANYLSQKGHVVTLVYQCDNAFANYKMPHMARYILSIIESKMGPKWFSLDNRIKRIVLNSFNTENFPDGDVVVATAVDTAGKVKSLPKNKGSKIYFIQHFEDWVIDKRDVLKTYQYGMTNIVIAKWLKEIVDKEADKPSVFIPNGISSEVFNVSIDVEKRNPYTISVLYHSSEWKGSNDALETLRRVKQLCPQLKVEMFGVPSPPENLESWIHYTQGASQNQLHDIYNKTAIYLCTSLSEGFGLTGAESMFCGCALVTTDTLGVREYTNENNSMICRPRDINALVSSVETLFKNNTRRIEMAKLGNKEIMDKLNLETACRIFEETIIAAKDNR